MLRSRTVRNVCTGVWMAPQTRAHTTIATTTRGHGRNQMPKIVLGKETNDSIYIRFSPSDSEPCQGYQVEREVCEAVHRGPPQRSNIGARAASEAGEYFGIPGDVFEADSDRGHNFVRCANLGTSWRTQPGRAVQQTTRCSAAQLFSSLQWPLHRAPEPEELGLSERMLR